MPSPNPRQRNLLIAAVVAVVAGGIGLWAVLVPDGVSNVVTDPTSTTTTTLQDEESATTTTSTPLSTGTLPPEDQFVLGPVSYPPGTVTLTANYAMTFELTEERFVEEWFSGFGIVAGEPSAEGAAFWPTLWVFDPMEETDGTPIETADDVVRVVSAASGFTVEPLSQTVELFTQSDIQGYSVRGPQEPTAVFGMGNRGTFQLPPVGEFYPVETPQGLIVIFVSGWNETDLEAAKTLFDQVAPTINLG